MVVNKIIYFILPHRQRRHRHN